MEHALERLFLALARGRDEFIAKSTARHAHRAFDNGDVFITRRKVALLEAVIGIAFVGGHKAGTHLHTGSAKIEELHDVRAGVHAASSDNRHGAAALVFHGLGGLNNLRHQDFKRVAGVLQLFSLETEVATSLGAFNHKGVRRVPKARGPFFGDYRGSSGRGNNGNQLGFEFFLLFLAHLQQVMRHVEGKASAGKDDVHLVFNSGAYHLAERGKRHHQVDADDSVAEFACFQYFIAQGAQIGCKRILGHIGFFHADHGPGDDADTSLIGNSRRKPGKRNAHAHATLNYRDFSREITYLECGERHCKTSVLSVSSMPLCIVSISNDIPMFAGKHSW